MPWLGWTWKKPLHRNANNANRSTEPTRIPRTWCSAPCTKPATKRARSSPKSTAKGIPGSEEALVSFMEVSVDSDRRYHIDIYQSKAGCVRIGFGTVRVPRSAKKIVSASAPRARDEVAEERACGTRGGEFHQSVTEDSAGFLEVCAQRRGWAGPRAAAQGSGAPSPGRSKLRNIRQDMQRCRAVTPVQVDHCLDAGVVRLTLGAFGWSIEAHPPGPSTCRLLNRAL